MKKLIVLFAIALLVSCAKDGKDGIMGPQGAPGESQKLSSISFSVSESQLVLMDSVAYYDKTISGLTRNSLVSVFEQFDGYAKPLPYTDPLDVTKDLTVEVVVNRSYEIHDGFIRILHETSFLQFHKFWRSGSYRVVVFE